MPDEAAVVEPLPRLTLLPLIVPQFWPVMDVPAQNVSSSDTSSETEICWAVLSATVPVSKAPVQLELE